jgi:hypothetical protein
VSTALYDLAQRLRAATERTVQPRTHYAHRLPPTDPVAVTLASTGQDDTRQAEPALVVTTPSGTHTSASGDSPLAALAAAGIRRGATHSTLVVPNRATLRALHRLARQTNATDPHDPQAAVIDWWQQRSEHPGTGAVLILTDALRQRWITGGHPDDEADLEHWRRWLNLPAASLLQLARHATNGHTLPGLLTFAGTDSRSWAYHRERIARGWNWRTSDSRQEAALGLYTRQDAADLYTSLTFDDPLTALRETHTGSIVPATITDLTAGQRSRVRQLRLTAHRPLTRLRPGNSVQAWIGTPGPGNPSDRISAVLDSTHVTPDGQLHLVLDDVTARDPIHLGDTITLRPKATDPSQQTNGRKNASKRYASHANWLTRASQAPAPRRRHVPLDVVMHAADDD